MSELRFLPSALVAWLVLLVPGPGPLALIVVAAGGGIARLCRQPGQSILICGVGCSLWIRKVTPVSPITLPARWVEFAAQFSARFSHAVATGVGPSSRGLIPGMVLGDTSLQTPVEHKMYVVTGLSHLSAVSGANISIITTAALIILRACAASPRVQVAGSLAAMAVFVVLVGPEPSVLRASVTGVVGLVAVVASARMQPVHALSLGVVGLLLLQPELARNFGFALSVAATAGIIGLFPYLYRVLAPLRLPDVLTRALAVAVAADCATMPIVAIMTGKISLVSVIANVAVAPATIVITVLGLIAALAAQLGLAGPVLTLIEPFTWWIYHVAFYLATLPLSTITARPVVVALAVGWALYWLKYPRVSIAVMLSALTVASYRAEEPRALNQVVAIESAEQAVDIPGVDAYLVTTPGPANPRPVRTPGGIPVLFPARDGPVRVMKDGTQRGWFSPR